MPEKFQFIAYPSFITLGSQIFSFIEPLFYLNIFLLLFIFVLNLNKTEFFSRCLKRTGEFSFGIFLIEVFFLTSVTIMLEKINFTSYNYLFYPIVFLSTLLLSVVSILVIRKIPFSQYIIGKIRD
jgi:peptidoglycan/LPS O-acetylase OafA/YrhL